LRASAVPGRGPAGAIGAGCDLPLFRQERRDSDNDAAKPLAHGRRHWHAVRRAANAPQNIDCEGIMSEAFRAPRSPAQLQRMRGIVSGEYPKPPIADLIGFRFVDVELGRSVFELEASHRHANPMGTLHGGVLCDLADIAMGSAFSTTLEEDETFTTVDLTMKFLKPIWKARLTATAMLTRRTRVMGLIECDVTDENGSLVAKAFSTCMVLRGQDAKGRTIGDAHADPKSGT
jgi:uncharacterized protein (TIGR00369 family)